MVFSPEAIKTIYVSPKVTARSLEGIKNRQPIAQNDRSAYVTYSPDRTKYAIGASYYCMHFLNYGDIIHTIKVFDAQTKKMLYASRETNQRDLLLIKFVDNKTVRAFYKGSEYIGSDTVVEWDLSNNGAWEN